MELNTEVILAVIVFFLVAIAAIFFRLGSILEVMQEGLKTQRAARSDNFDTHQELLKKLDELTDKVDDLLLPLQEISNNVDDIESVTHIFGKYKLPNKKEQQELDSIAIDMEVWDGISNAANRKKV